MVSCKQATPTRPADDPSFTSEHEVLILLYLNGSGEALSGFEFTSDERLVDHDLGDDVRQPTSLPCFHLLSHRLRVGSHTLGLMASQKLGPNQLGSQFDPELA
jgi:hypothetical protein